jgi:assimilatory nitrate reductase catalytic subunit
LSGDTAAEAWLRDWLVAEHDVATERAGLLMPAARAPSGFAPRGAVVCTCFDVAETAVIAKLAAVDGTVEAALRDVQESLKCGTNCGSCLPELKRLAATMRKACAV